MLQMLLYYISYFFRCSLFQPILCFIIRDLEQRYHKYMNTHNFFLDCSSKSVLQIDDVSPPVNMQLTFLVKQNISNAKGYKFKRCLNVTNNNSQGQIATIRPYRFKWFLVNLYFVARHLDFELFKPLNMYIMTIIVLMIPVKTGANIALIPLICVS